MDFAQAFTTHPAFQQHHQQHDYSEPHQQPHYHDFESSSQTIAAMQDHPQNIYSISQTGQKISCDVKPRLTKEQHDILEAHYQKQQKPNTNTKRSFAEALNVSLEKVNNWFQNRRAKSKQDAKKQQGPVSVFGVSRPSQISLCSASSDSEASPAFPSPGYFQMMHEEEDIATYQQPQQPIARTQLVPEMSGFLHPDTPDLQELNRRTLTQEQFDAYTQQEMMLNSGNLASMLTADPEAYSFLPGYNHDGQQVQHTTMPAETGIDFSAMQQHAVGSPGDEWTDSRSSSASSFEQHGISTPMSQLPPSRWQPGQSVPVDFGQLNEEFQKVAQGRHIPIEWPTKGELVRQDSSTSLITQSMGNVGLQTPQTAQQPFRSPTPTSSLAARRQRQRPTPLGLASLRSQSYSGTPQTSSPGQMQPPSHTPPQLRRIKSSNVVGGIAQGRVQKNIAAPPRSPLNWSFTDAISSPQATRHQPSQSTSALAPPTPMSPPSNNSEFTRAQQQWQNMSKHIKREASISETDDEHAFGLSQNFTSPPHTPMFYPHQQFMPPQMMPGNIIMENTPPQSAPASQQCFPQSIYGHPPMHQYKPPVMYQPQMQQVFMPLPQHMIDSTQLHMTAPPQFTVTTSGPSSEIPMQFAQNGLPIVDAQGQISLAMPSQLQFVHKKMSRADSKQSGQIPAGSQTTFSIINQETMPMQVTAQVPKHSSQASSDFFVHEYTPPQDIKRTVTPRKTVDSGPKNYTFANQTPEHFEKGKKSSTGSSPDSAASA